ncbi:MAG: ArsR/SmtB family transcription factor [Alphaproteobacteria bacterium]
MENLLPALRAAAEPTRLRLLALCARSDLTVTDLTQILGQSQPRLSRHLKVMCDAGLIHRTREGTNAFFRAQSEGLAPVLAQMMPPGDPTLTLDARRLGEIKHTRAAKAAVYFRKNAASWDKLRDMHVENRLVEEALCRCLPPNPVDSLLDIGTGTGRMLELFGPRAKQAVGVDSSREMLALARVNLENAGLRNCELRQADMYQLPWLKPSFDVITIHMVLHYAEYPAAVIAEAARVLRPGGRLLIVDFAPHALESLRKQHAHYWLGFATPKIATWCHQAALGIFRTVDLPGDPLTVCIWQVDAIAADIATADTSARTPQ